MGRDVNVSYEKLESWTNDFENNINALNSTLSDIKNESKRFFEDEKNWSGTEAEEVLPQLENILKKVPTIKEQTADDTNYLKSALSTYKHYDKTNENVVDSSDRSLDADLVDKTHYGPNHTVDRPVMVEEIKVDTGTATGSPYGGATVVNQNVEMMDGQENIDEIKSIHESNIEEQMNNEMFS